MSDEQVMQLITGGFFLLITVFGFHLALITKRTRRHKVNLLVVYSVPLVLTINTFVPELSIPKDHVVLLVCAFIICIHVLYWGEVKTYTTKPGYYRKILIDFLDMMPDMVWMKDPENRFTYTNKAIRDGLLKCSADEAFGKTGIEIADMQREKGHTYTFGEICGDSDKITVERDKPSRFLETGKVNGKFLALQVFKAPIYRVDHTGKKVFAGTIGMGRDLTYDVVDHERLSDLLKKGDVDAATELFRIHKSRYLFTGTSVIDYRGNEDDKAAANYRNRDNPS